MTSMDKMLLLRWQQRGDTEAFATIVTRYSGLVYGACCRILRNSHEAEDTTQQCFLRLAAADTERIQFLGGWLHSVALNLCRDHVRRQDRRVRIEAEYSSRQASPASEWDEIQPHIDEAIDALPDRLRVAIHAHFLEGKTHEAIAAELGITRSAISKRIERGIERVRQHLKKRGVTGESSAMPGFLAQIAQVSAPGSLEVALRRMALTGPAASKGISVVGTKTAHLSGQYWAGLATLVVSAALVAYFSARGAGPQHAPGSDGLIALTQNISTQDRILDSPASQTDGAPTIISLAHNPNALAPQPAVVVNQRAEELTFPDAGTETVVVNCRDIAGEAVAYAEVYLEQFTNAAIPMQNDEEDTHLRAKIFGPIKADEGGEAIFYSVPKLSYSRLHEDHRFVHARVPGSLVGSRFLPARFAVNGGKLEEVVLVASADVRGVVKVPANFDVRAVNVRVLNASTMSFDDPRFGFISYSETHPWRDGLKVAVDVGGEFVISDLPVNTSVSLSAQGPGLAEEQFRSTPGRPQQETTAILEPESVISGIVEREDGTRVANQTVLARPQQGLNTSDKSGKTDENGMYRIGGLKYGRYAMRVPVGRQPSEWNASLKYVDVTSGSTLADVTLSMHKGQLVSGKIKDKDTGIGLSDAIVIGLNGNAGREAVAGTVTGADGNFEFRMPEGNAHIYVAALPANYESPGNVKAVDRAIKKDGAPITDIDIAIAKLSASARHGQATVTGKVIDSDGKPVPSLAIIREHEYIKDQKMSGTVTTTDQNGRFSIMMYAPVRLSLMATGLGYRGEKGEEFDLNAGDIIEVEDIVVEIVDSEVCGTVVDEAGNPVADARVLISAEGFRGGDEKTVTDESGRVCIEGVPDAPLDIRVEKENRLYGLAHAEPGEEFHVVIRAPQSGLDELRLKG